MQGLPGQVGGGHRSWESPNLSGRPSGGRSTCFSLSSRVPQSAPSGDPYSEGLDSGYWRPGASSHHSPNITFPRSFHGHTAPGRLLENLCLHKPADSQSQSHTFRAILETPPCLGSTRAPVPARPATHIPQQRGPLRWAGCFLRRQL